MEIIHKNMSKMVILSGLPGSGKTTLAKELLKQGNTVRINKDELRVMLHANKFTGYNESITRAMSRMIAKECLRDGINVIIDDTNLNPGTCQSWVDLAKEMDAKIEYQDLTSIPVWQCLERDIQREKKVGSTVIQKMALQYLDYLIGVPIVVCDLDGTLCNIDHRLQYAHGEQKDWNKFFSLISEDIRRNDVLDKVISSMYDETSKLILVSARPENYRKQTEEWLEKNHVLYDILIMRDANDKREDSIVKREIYNKYLKNLNIIKVFDDRPRVIRMWRKLGLSVEDVGNGIEF